MCRFFQTVNEKIYIKIVFFPEESKYKVANSISKVNIIANGKLTSELTSTVCKVIHEEMAQL